MSEQTTDKVLPACPVETTLTLIGDKWKVLILRDLLPGRKRFGELKKSSCKYKFSFIFYRLFIHIQNISQIYF